MEYSFLLFSPSVFWESNLRSRKSQDTLQCPTFLKQLIPLPRWGWDLAPVGVFFGKRPLFPKHQLKCGGMIWDGNLSFVLFSTPGFTRVTRLFSIPCFRDFYQWIAAYLFFCKRLTLSMGLWQMSQKGEGKVESLWGPREENMEWWEPGSLDCGDPGPAVAGVWGGGRSQWGWGWLPGIFREVGS